MRNPGTAALLSFLLPGLGQLYNGKFLRAILWFILAGGTWIFSAGVLGWVIHILSAGGAYNSATTHPYR
jgi:TM2 domain-containing membrane protein YozV